MAPFTLENLAKMVQWVQRAYPCEGCGLLLEHASGQVRVLECENLADRYHALDPEAFPRTSRDFYMLNPMEFVRAEERGERVAAVFHSHPDVGDYFSAEDIAAALLPRDSDEEPFIPAHPGTDYLVISVRAGRADRATLFAFQENRETFEPVRVFGPQELHPELAPA